MINNASEVILVCLVLGIGTACCSGVPPGNLGVKDGRLSPCPATPNCVSSQSIDNEHVVEPLMYTVSTPEAFAVLKKIILDMKRTKIVAETDTYLRVECMSAILRFVDDVEFYFDGNARVIHVRSASRLGKYDFSVNRKRVETIRAAWKTEGKR